MRSTPFSKLIGKSYERTELILWKPFSLKKWMALLFIACMAGAYGGGFHWNNVSNFRDQEQRKISARTRTTTVSKPSITAPAGQKGVSVGSAAPIVGSEKSKQVTGSGGKQSPPINYKVIISHTVDLLKDKKNWPWIGLIAALYFAFVYFFLWLGSRFQFIWLEAVMENTSLIKAPFAKCRREADSLFGFLFIFSIFSTLYFGGFIAFFAMLAFRNGLFSSGFPWTFALAVSVFLWPVLILIFSIVIFGVFYFFVKNFVVVIMAKDSCGFLKATRTFSKIYSENRKDLWLYLLVNFGLSFMLGFFYLAVVIVIILLAILILGIPLIFLAFIKAFMAMLVLGVLFLIPVFGLIILVGLPFAVFSKCFSLYYFSSLGTSYVPLALEPVIDAS